MLISTTLQNTKQWQCEMLIHSLQTLKQCFCEAGQKSAIRDGQNVDLQIAGGGGGGRVVRLLRPPWLRACCSLQNCAV